MGARQSKRSVDITTTPKKGDSDIIAEGEGKLEKIGDADVKVATNGTLPHNDLDVGEKEENSPAEKDQPTAELKENGLPEEDEVKTPNTPDTDTSSTDQLNESAVTDKTADSANNSKIEETPETKEKKKEKKKRKWSLRSISFSKKDKSKPSKEDKSEDVAEVAEENAEEPTTSPITETPKEEEKLKSTIVEEKTAEAEEQAKPAAAPKVEEPVKTTEEPKSEEAKPAPIAEEPKVIEPVCEKPTESAPSPIKEDVPQVETSKIVEDSEPVESKEVRSDDVPPPLPSSNPPSPVTVFAESTKADALSAQEVPLLQSPPASLEILESASGSDVASIESKQEVTPVKVEAGDVKSELFVSESEKTENELKTVEQKTIDITSESSDAMMSSDNSCAKNLSETLNNVSSIETSETVVAPSEPLLKSEDTSSDAPISSEAVLESIQTPIEEIPVDIPTQSDTKIDVVSELAQEQPVDIVTSDISEKIETLSEPLKTPESTEVLTEETKILNVPPESSSNASEEILPLVVEAPIELQSLPDPPTEVPEALESTETLPEVPAEIESCPVREINSVSDTLEKVEAAIVEAPEELKKLTETNPVSSESLPVPPKLDEIPISIKTTGLDQEQTPSVENSPVATQSYVTLPVSPPPSPALVQDSSKPSLDGSLLEPAMPSPETEQFAINAADSLQDISTESLPSLPEPFSENFAEPMSLPPVDSVPEPIAVDSPTSEPPLVTECPAPVPSKNSEVLTNGNTNGLPSPVNEECSSAQPMMTEGPLKQVISNDASDVRQDVGDSTTDSSGAPAESAKVEE